MTNKKNKQVDIKAHLKISFLSRKFLMTLITLLLITTLLLFRFITSSDFVKITIAVVVAYLATNVTNKIINNRNNFGGYVR